MRKKSRWCFSQNIGRVGFPRSYTRSISNQEWVVNIKSLKVYKNNDKNKISNSILQQIMV